MRAVMNWNSLPWEMVELILLSLTLVQLARVSSTCRTFQTFFSRRVARQQKALCDQALECFGRDRIACIAGLLDRFLNRGTVDPRLTKGVTHACWVSADGVLHVSDPANPLTPAHRCHDVGYIRIFLHVDNMPIYNISFDSTSMQVKVGDRGSSQVYLSIGPSRKVLGISIVPGGDDDTEGVALVYTLLSGGVAPSLGDRGLVIDVRVRDDTEGCTWAGLQNQIVPMIPSASVYVGADTVRGGGQPSQGGSSTGNIITLYVG
jgi:hypothetical protein